MFEREDWTLFRTLATLGQKAGVPVEKIPALIAKELADNALDATGDCKIGLLRANGFFVEDAGEGIPGDDQTIARLFSIRRPLASSKLLRLPSRGALGNGLRVVAGAVLATAGSLIVTTRGRSLHLVPQETGETIAVKTEESSLEGTRVEVRLGDTLVNSDDLLPAREAQYLAIDAVGYLGKSSPHWYDGDAFYELLQATTDEYLTAQELIAVLDGCAEPKAGQIVNAAALQRRPANSLNRSEAETLLEKAKDRTKPVSVDRLGRTSDAQIDGEYVRVPTAFKVRSSRARSDATIPAMVEIWARVNGTDRASLRVSVNRTPVFAPVEAYHAKTYMDLFGCGLEHQINGIGRKPITAWVNVITPHMPITSDGKAPDLSVFETAIAIGIGKAAKKAQRTAPSTRTGILSQKDAIIQCLLPAIEKAGGGRHRYSLRQLYYATRELVKAEWGVTEPTWSYFCSVITDYEAEQGKDLPGITRDNRGTLYHPHIGDEIPLGTLSVEAYERPDWTFNKVLYCEKEGFFPVLKDTRWPERNDCALLTSKGFASRAARDVIDLLGDTEEELTFFCIHDADAYGTMIYQALQDATRARPGRRVKIINLGLDPSEAIEMGLPVEPVERKGDKKTAPVAEYITDPAWRAWLQDNRIELNAMTTPQFLEWLDRKFTGHAGKVIPPGPVLHDQLAKDVRAGLMSQISTRILRDAHLDDQVQAAYVERSPLVAERTATIDRVVRVDLGREPAEPWGQPVRRVAEEIVNTTEN